MKKISLALTLFILVGICIPVVSAEVLIDEEFTIYRDTGGTYVSPDLTHDLINLNIDTIELKHIENHPELYYIGIQLPTVADNRRSKFKSEGGEITYTGLDGTKTGRYHVTTNKNFLGQITSYRYLIFLDDWDIGDKTGVVKIKLSEPLYTVMAQVRNVNDLNNVVNLRAFSGGYDGRKYSVTIVSTSNWKNRLIVDDNTHNSYNINLQRVYGDKPYASRIDILSGTNTSFSQETTNDFWTLYPKNDIDTIKITALGQEFVRLLGATEPDGPDTPVTIYVRNSQTNALIADSHILISASVNDNLHEVINKTLPSGIYNGELQPTGGGMPNPDFYRLTTTAEGYNSIMPYIDFEVGQGATIYAYLEPVGGAPENENNTFIDFYVRDLAANPISGATVNFGGYTLITNSAGYTIFEVEKDKTYSWTVSKSGYGSLTGNAVIGSDTRHTINTVISPAVTPTMPTSMPTSTPISPTPTMTAPTGEPVSNLFEWFAAHFGMVLGGGVEIGKIFMWLCFSVPVGVYVGKEAKAGAAGFMAGAGVVTLFFVLIGWVPIWIVVLLALIIGLLYAKVFNNSDNGGGR